MLAEDIIRYIGAQGLVAVVRAETDEKAFEIVEALIEGGVYCIELTFTVPFAHRVIEALAKRYGNNKIILGAGTVLDSETARIAMLSGAQFIVSPHLDLETVKICNRYRMPVMPGVMSVSEAICAMEAGADILKVFPGEVLGPNFIKAIKGPLPMAQIMPTGGINLDNAGKWLDSGACALGVGGSLTKGSYEEIVARAKEFKRIIKLARSEEGV